MPLIAGEVSLDEVMERLAETRPVFHSEADFQHEFARMVTALRPELEVRLEVPARSTTTRRSRYLDLLVSGFTGRTAIELKYPTNSWSGTVRRSHGPDEQFHLRSHSAHDLARLHVVHDVTRLEATRDTYQGIVIILTNVRSLWAPPATPAASRDRAFRLHEGARLTGDLVWGDDDYPKNNRTLTGDYTMRWHEYQHEYSEFRWSALEIS